MNLHGNHVGALVEEGGAEVHRSRVGVARGVGVAIGVVAALAHVVACGFHAIHVNDESVVDLVVEFEHIGRCRSRRKIDVAAEIVGGTLVAAVVAIIDCGLQAILAISQWAVAAMPPVAGGIVAGVGPCRSVETALVVVVPCGSPFEDGPQVGVDAFPTTERVARWRLCPQGDGSEEVAVEATCGNLYAIDIQAGARCGTAEGGLLSVGHGEPHGGVIAERPGGC